MKFVVENFWKDYVVLKYYNFLNNVILNMLQKRYSNLIKHNEKYYIILYTFVFLD